MNRSIGERRPTSENGPAAPPDGSATAADSCLPRSQQPALSWISDSDTSAVEPFRTTFGLVRIVNDNRQVGVWPGVFPWPLLREGHRSCPPDPAPAPTDEGSDHQS